MHLICNNCGKGTEKDPIVGQDDSLYVCSDCAEKRNQPAYKAEIVELEAVIDPTVSQVRRIAYLKNKLQ